MSVDEDHMDGVLPRDSWLLGVAEKHLELTIRDDDGRI